MVGGDSVAELLKTCYSPTPLSASETPPTVPSETAPTLPNIPRKKSGRAGVHWCNISTLARTALPNPSFSHETNGARRPAMIVTNARSGPVDE